MLNGLSNIHAGGESVDVTELVHPDLTALAVDAVRAIPGLGVAVSTSDADITSADGAVILEANVQANFGCTTVRRTATTRRGRRDHRRDDRDGPDP